MTILYVIWFRNNEALFFCSHTVNPKHNVSKHNTSVRNIYTGDIFVKAEHTERRTGNNNMEQTAIHTEHRFDLFTDFEIICLQFHAFPYFFFFINS